MVGEGKGRDLNVCTASPLLSGWLIPNLVIIGCKSDWGDIDKTLPPPGGGGREGEGFECVHGLKGGGGF